MGMSQMCTGAGDYFRTSKPHSEKLWHYLGNYVLASLLHLESDDQLLSLSNFLRINRILGKFFGQHWDNLYKCPFIHQRSFHMLKVWRWKVIGYTKYYHRIDVNIEKPSQGALQRGPGEEVPRPRHWLLCGRGRAVAHAEAEALGGGRHVQPHHRADVRRVAGCCAALSGCLLVM